MKQSLGQYLSFTPNMFPQLILFLHHCLLLTSFLRCARRKHLVGAYRSRSDTYITVFSHCLSQVAVTILSLFSGLLICSEPTIVVSVNRIVTTTTFTSCPLCCRLCMAWHCFPDNGYKCYSKFFTKEIFLIIEALTDLENRHSSADTREGKLAFSTILG